MDHTRLKGASSSAAPIAREKDFYYLLYTLPVSGYDLVTRATREYYTGSSHVLVGVYSCACVHVCVLCMLHAAAVRVVGYYETKLFKRNLNFHYGFNLYFTRRIGSRDKCDIILYKCVCVCVCVYNVCPTKVSKNKCKHTAHFNIQVWCFPAWTWLRERKCGILNVNIQGVSPCGCSRTGHICIII